jgi:Flp pilus assembly pilin Flp
LTAAVSLAVVSVVVPEGLGVALIQAFNFITAPMDCDVGVK